MTEDDDMFYCSFVSIHYIICECGETFPSEEDLKTHLEIEHPHKKEIKEFKCGVCEKAYSKEEECIRHYEQNHVEIEIDTEVLDEDGFTGGSDPESEVETKVAQKVICESCGKVYSSKSRHTCRLDAETKKPTRTKKKKEKTIKNTVCEVCGKKYTSAAALKYHQRVHTGERPYKCPMCEKTFTMPLFLRIHVRTHTGEKPYECVHCPKAFGNKAAQMRHMRVHTGEKPYNCPKCGKAFSQSNSMKIHYSTVHLKLPAPYKSKKRKLEEMQRNLAKLGAEPPKKKSTSKNIMNAVNSIIKKNKVFIKVEEDQCEKMEVKTEDEYASEATLYDEHGNEMTYEVVYGQ